MVMPFQYPHSVAEIMNRAAVRQAVAIKNGSLGCRDEKLLHRF
jgi:hypothetical protein